MKLGFTFGKRTEFVRIDGRLRSKATTTTDFRKATKGVVYCDPWERGAKLVETSWGKIAFVRKEVN